MQFSIYFGSPDHVKLKSWCFRLVLVTPSTTMKPILFVRISLVEIYKIEFMAPKIHIGEFGEILGNRLQDLDDAAAAHPVDAAWHQCYWQIQRYN